MKQSKILSKVRKAAVTGLAGLIGFLPIGCANIKKEPLRGYVETGVVSDYVPPGGSRLAGESSQNLVSLSKGPLSGFVFYTRAIGGGEDSGKDELDLGVSYKVPITENLSFNPLAMAWLYPGNVLGEHTNYHIGGKFVYKGPVDLSVGGIHMIPHEGSEAGECYSGKISKTFPLTKKDNDWKVSLTPELSANYSNDFFGITGFRHLSPGLRLSIGKGNVSFNAFVRRQFSLNRDTTEQFTYGGVSVGYRF